MYIAYTFTGNMIANAKLDFYCPFCGYGAPHTIFLSLQLQLLWIWINGNVLLLV